MKQQHPSSAPVADLMHDEAGSRYVARIGGDVVAQAQYRMEGGKVAFTHTEVDGAYRGQGLGSRVAAYALDDVRRRGLKAVPQCSFIAAYIARHEKDYGELLAR
jgi:uncharacterized protein